MLVDRRDKVNRGIALLGSISAITSVLPSPPEEIRFIVSVDPNGTYDVPLCVTPNQLNCLWAGDTVIATYLDQDDAVLSTEAIGVPEVCTVAFESWELVNAAWCVTVVVTVVGNSTVTPARIGVYGDRLVFPLFPDIAQSAINDVRNNIPYNVDNGTVVCGLQPVGRYRVWVGDAAALCTDEVLAPTTPIVNAPELVTSVPSSVSSSSVSFFIHFQNQTDDVTHIAVEWHDSFANVTHQTVWSETSLVRTIQVGVPGVVYRTFITNTGGPVFPNTVYRMRAANANASGARTTPFTAYLTEKTLVAVQPRPLQPVVSTTPEGLVHVAFNTLRFRPYGNNNTITFVVLVKAPDSFDNDVVDRVNCSGLCPDGITLPQAEERTRFVQCFVTNEAGTSEVSGLSVILRADTSGSKDTTGIIAGTVAGVVLGALALLTVVVFLRARPPVIVEVLRPDPDPATEIPRASLVRMSDLGAGSTSTVYEASYSGERQDGAHVPPVGAVAVKQMRVGLSAEQIEGFFGEIATLARLRHDNIIHLIGAVTVGNPVLVVTELCAYGALNTYVKTRDVSQHQLREWTSQMCMAVRYLHSESIVHRDLACRNFLITASATVKLCDLGMCKALDYSRQYQQRVEISVAVRWAAPISLLNGTFDTGTDVWSLCASFFEIYTHGQEPYSEFKSYKSVFEGILSGARLTAPHAMPADIAGVCTSVWQAANLDNVTTEVFTPIYPCMRAEPIDVRVSVAGARAPVA